MHLPRTRILIAAALAAVAALLPLAASGQAVAYRAALTGANEVPATASTATGTFTANLDEAAGTLTWTLTVPAITNTTAAHLHAGAAGANGGIVLPLFQAPTGSPAGSISVSGTARAADLTGALAGNFAGFVTALKAGGIYANVHTTASPGGEIRAQVTSGTAAAAPAAAPAQAATPVAPKTGNAGLANGSNAAMLAALVVLAAGVVAGGRVLASRRA